MPPPSVLKSCVRPWMNRFILFWMCFSRIIPMPDVSGWTETMDDSKAAEDGQVEEVADDDDGNVQEETNE